MTTQGKDNFLNKCSWRPVQGLHVVLAPQNLCGQLAAAFDLHLMLPQFLETVGIVVQRRCRDHQEDMLGYGSPAKHKADWYSKAWHAMVWYSIV